MIRFETPKTRSRSIPHAFGVLEGRTAASTGFQAALNRDSAALDRQGFTGKLGQVAQLSDGLVAVGLGAEASADTVRAAAGHLARSLGTVDRVGTSLHQIEVTGAVAAVVEGLGLGGYQFLRYKNHPGREYLVELHGASAVEAGKAKIGVRAESFARDLVNIPAGDKAPADLAALIGDHAASFGLKVDIWDETRMAAEEINGTLAVAAGSTRPPRFVRLSYRPRGATGTLALVGKGIVFDSGGLSLKPADAMEPMKTDMSGAAAVAGAIGGIAAAKTKVNVEAYLPITDNMPGGGAMRPGDVIRYRNKRTIEVLNTDAEGRLVLADGLLLAAEGEPNLIVDIATLTGAQRIAFGDRVGAAFGNDRCLVEKVVAAGAMAGERFWPMPLVPDYHSMIESKVADVKNTGGRYAGAIVAGLILEPFVGGTPWVHLDIAGPARAENPYQWFTAGGTGFGTRTLMALAAEMAR